MINKASSAKTLELRNRWFSKDTHPYAAMEALVRSLLAPESTLLDAGCGRGAPVLAQFEGHAARLIGIDQIEFSQNVHGCELFRRDLSDTGLAADSIDVIYSRSVFEHLEDPARVLMEFHRVMKQGGKCVVLTASLWDYVTLVSMLIPNRFHAPIVSRTEGRAPEDVFPAHYRCNTRGAVARCARRSGLILDNFSYLGQYPAYFSFSPALFSIASLYEKALRRFPTLHPLLGWILFTLRKPAPSHEIAP